MPISLDPEIHRGLVAAASASEAVQAPNRGDALALRKMIDQALRGSYSTLVHDTEVSTRDITITASDGATIAARWYTPNADVPGSAVVYLHGGGMLAGSIDLFDPLVRHYTSVTGVPFLAVDYRLAPEHIGTRPAQDCFESTRWLYEHAQEMGVDSNRIAVMGDSAGGGLAASVAIQAREYKIRLARQILVYPMLDDRTTSSDPNLAPTATWTYDNNYTGWAAVLGNRVGSEHISPVSAPARLVDFAELTNAYIEIGELDIFRDETLAYAASLGAAGVSCELHVHPGAPHGYEWLAADSELTRRVLADRTRVVRSL